MLRNEYAQAAEAFFDGLVRQGMTEEQALDLVARWCMYHVRLPTGPIREGTDEDEDW
jgi:hypothetical protein